MASFPGPLAVDMLIFMFGLVLYFPNTVAKDAFGRWTITKFERITGNMDENFLITDSWVKVKNRIVRPLSPGAVAFPQRD